MKKRLTSDLDYNLWVLLYQVRDLIFRARENELRKYGFLSRQAMVIFIIEAIDGKATPTEIAKWALREPHSISAILDRMEKDGLVSKVKDSRKKSQVNISLTEKGKQVYNQSLKRESIWEIMSCLSAEEHQQLWKTLEKLRARAFETRTKVTELPFPDFQ